MTHEIELAVTSPTLTHQAVASLTTPSTPSPPASGQPSTGFKLTKPIEWPRWTKSYDVFQTELRLDDETKDPSAYLNAVFRTVTQLCSDEPDWQQVVVAFRDSVAYGTDERT